MTAEMDLGAPISSMELAHGGGTLSVTSGSKVHFLDILRYVLSRSSKMPSPTCRAPRSDTSRH